LSPVPADAFPSVVKEAAGERWHDASGGPAANDGGGEAGGGAEAEGVPRAGRAAIGLPPELELIRAAALVEVGPDHACCRQSVCQRGGLLVCARLPHAVQQGGHEAEWPRETRLRGLGRRAPGTSVPARHRSSDASLMRRPEATAARNRELAEDNRRLRHQLAQALGQLRAAGIRPDPVTWTGGFRKLLLIRLDLVAEQLLLSARLRAGG
jgi:hypothetical protein